MDAKTTSERFSQFERCEKHVRGKRASFCSSIDDDRLRFCDDAAMRRRGKFKAIEKDPAVI